MVRSGSRRQGARQTGVTQHFIPDKEPEDPPPPDPNHATVIGFAVVALLVILGLYLTHELRDMSKIQDCAMQGRSNCAPIDTSPQN